MPFVHALVPNSPQPLLDPVLFVEAEAEGVCFLLPDMPELPDNLRNTVCRGHEMLSLVALGAELLGEAATVRDRLAGQRPVSKALKAKHAIQMMEAESNEILGYALLIGASDAVIM